MSMAERLIKLDDFITEKIIYKEILKYDRF